LHRATTLATLAPEPTTTMPRYSSRTKRETREVPVLTEAKGPECCHVLPFVSQVWQPHDRFPGRHSPTGALPGLPHKIHRQTERPPPPSYPGGIPTLPPAGRQPVGGHLQVRRARKTLRGVGRGAATPAPQEESPEEKQPAVAPGCRGRCTRPAP